MKDVMVDLETLGNTSTAAIIQIGACVFDTEGTGERFCATVSFESALQWGDPTASTLEWWMEQSDAARKSVLAEPRMNLTRAKYV